ncbi:hypothetical protein K438DRAFT_1766274 [Mycena galopus ATCC 62051]|nr:hypothetical protein K438DRAFT_1766274 [Mycena galopus ATCC 62051]
MLGLVQHHVDEEVDYYNSRISAILHAVQCSLIHQILGAPPEFDPSIAYLYDTILHHVPNVQFLNIVFCSPVVAGIVHVPRIARSVIKEMDACRQVSFTGPDCSSDQQWRSANAVPEEGQSSIIINYEDYVQSEGAAFHPPDLAVATNCFLTTTDPELWRRTIKMLVARHIPSMFTNMDPNFGEVHGFHAPNAWLTGEFSLRARRFDDFWVVAIQ